MLPTKSVVPEGVTIAGSSKSRSGFCLHATKPTYDQKSPSKPSGVVAKHGQHQTSSTGSGSHQQFLLAVAAESVAARRQGAAATSREEALPPADEHETDRCWWDRGRARIRCQGLAARTTLPQLPPPPLPPVQSTTAGGGGTAPTARRRGPRPQIW